MASGSAGEPGGLRKLARWGNPGARRRFGLGTMEWRKKVHVAPAGHLPREHLPAPRERIRLHPRAGADNVASLLRDDLGRHEPTEDLGHRALIRMHGFGESLLGPLAAGRRIHFDPAESRQLDHNALGQSGEICDRRGGRLVRLGARHPRGRGGRIGFEEDRGRSAGTGVEGRPKGLADPAVVPSVREPCESDGTSSRRRAEDEPEEWVQPPFTAPLRVRCHRSGKEESYG